MADGCGTAVDTAVVCGIGEGAGGTVSSIVGSGASEAVGPAASAVGLGSSIVLVGIVIAGVLVAGGRRMTVCVGVPPIVAVNVGATVPAGLQAHNDSTRRIVKQERRAMMKIFIQAETPLPERLCGFYRL